MQWCFGRGKYGPVEDTLETTWEEFVDLLADAAKLPRSPDAKHEHWWLSPMIRHPGATRRTIDDVSHMGELLGLDLDHGNIALHTIQQRLAPLNAAYIAHSTAQSQIAEPRWRLLLWLDRQTTWPEYRRLIGFFATLFDLDRTVWNPNRIFYGPALWHGADNVFHTNAGQPVVVDDILARMPEEVTPPPTRVAPEAGTRAAPEGTIIVTPAILQAAMQAPKGGRFYRLMCAAATRYRLQGWHLSASDLAHAAMLASAQFAPGTTRPNPTRQAQRAIDWAANRFTSPTPLQRMRDRILWERSR